MFADGHLWNMDIGRYFFYSVQGYIGPGVMTYYDAADAQRKPLAQIGKDDALMAQATFSYGTKVYKAVNSPTKWIDSRVFDSNTNPVSNSSKTSNDLSSKLVTLEEIVPPAYTAPLTIVAK